MVLQAANNFLCNSKDKSKINRLCPDENIADNNVIV